MVRARERQTYSGIRATMNSATTITSIAQEPRIALSFEASNAKRRKSCDISKHLVQFCGENLDI